MKSRLMEFIASRKISVRRFEIECGFPNSYVSNLKSNITSKRLDAIVARYPELNVAWLLTGRGDMVRMQPKAGTGQETVVEPMEQRLADMNMKLMQTVADLSEREMEMNRRYQNCIDFMLSHKDKILAEDITQFCFMQLWEHKETVSAYKNLPAWLYVTARNAIYKETRQQIVATKYIDFATETFERYQMATDGNIDYMLIIKEIEKFIASLPETRRKVFMMKAFQDKSVKEIADTMSISPKTVETHIHRAYTALRAAVAKLAFAVACLFITSL